MRRRSLQLLHLLVLVEALVLLKLLRWDAERHHRDPVLHRHSVVEVWISLLHYLILSLR